MGPGNATSQGVRLHSLVAAAWPAADPDPAAKRPALPLLGLPDQQFHMRQPVPDAEKTHPHGGSRPRQGRVRGSALWAQRLRAVGCPPAGTRWVVADCGANIYEHLRQCQAQGLGFVVRAAQNRALVAGADKTAAGRLFERARALPGAGTFALALVCARQYASRWLIEDFHKALKTGLRAEKRQLQTAARLFAAVTLLSVVALALVDLREKSRLEPDLPAGAAGLTATDLRVLRHQSRRLLDMVRAVYLALAALGGHLGRKGDGPSGWQTRWLGRCSLRLLVEGVNMVAQLPDE